jgi:hypothetical protein
LIRIRFASKLLEANTLLANKSIDVNGSFKQKSYLVRVNDIIKRKSIPKLLVGKDTKPRFFPTKWRKFL